MRRTIFLLLFMTLCTLSLTTESLSGENLTGKWLMNANGYKFILTIQQDNPTFFTGSLEPLNHEAPVSQVEGKTLPGDEARGLTPRINFRGIENKREYLGYLFVGAEKRRHMAGTFGYSEDPREHEAGWLAERL